MSIHFLCHFDGTNGSTIFIDEIGNYTPIAGGNAALTTTGQVFGSACLNIAGGSVTIGSSLPFYNQNHTIRFRYTAHIDDLTGAYRTVAIIGYAFVLVDNGYLLVVLNFDDSTMTEINLGSIADGFSFAIAIERYNDIFYVYLDGFQVANYEKIGNVYDGNLTIGQDGDASIKGLIDEFLIDIGESYAQGAVSYTVETEPFSIMPTIPDFQLINYCVSGFDAALQNKLAPISAFDAELINYLCSAIDATLQSVGYSAEDFQLQTRQIEYSKFDAALKNIGYSITAFDATLVNDAGIMISKGDFELINFMLADSQSIVINIHNPQQPIYGNYQ